jgi:hypothetical protein
MDAATSKPAAQPCRMGSCSPRAVHRLICIVSGSLAILGAGLSFGHPGFAALTALGGLLLIISGVVSAKMK